MAQGEETMKNRAIATIITAVVAYILILILGYETIGNIAMAMGIGVAIVAVVCFVLLTPLMLKARRETDRLRGLAQSCLRSGDAQGALQHYRTILMNHAGLGEPAAKMLEEIDRVFVSSDQKPNAASMGRLQDICTTYVSTIKAQGHLHPDLKTLREQFAQEVKGLELTGRQPACQQPPARDK